jgi:excisionase family DNA binding protein
MEFKIICRRMMSTKTHPVFDALRSVGDQLLKVRHVCELLDISRATLRRLVQAGEVTPIQLGRRTVRFSLQEIRQFIEKRKNSRVVQIRPDNFAVTEAEEELIARVQKKQRALTLGGG